MNIINNSNWREIEVGDIVRHKKSGKRLRVNEVGKNGFCYCVNLEGGGYAGRYAVSDLELI